MMDSPVKTCIKCREAKPFLDFYKHPHMADGHLGACKACHKQAMFENRRDNPEVRERERERAKRPERRELARVITLSHRAKNPDAYRAQTAVNNAVRDGRLTKPKVCDLCDQGGEAIHGHHRDYSSPWTSYGYALDATIASMRCFQNWRARTKLRLEIFYAKWRFRLNKYAFRRIYMGRLDRGAPRVARG